MRELNLKRRLIALYNRLQDDYFDYVRKHEKETDTKATEYWYDKASIQAGIMDGVAKAASEALGIRSDDFLLLCYVCFMSLAKVLRNFVLAKCVADY